MVKCVGTYIEFLTNNFMFKNEKKLTRITAALLFVGVVAVNYLANALPIGGISTGEISDAYPNLFAPAGITFSIWGIIYLLLAVFVVYQFVYLPKRKNNKLETTVFEINKYFIISSVANIAWIFSWHYQIIGLSVLLMAILLISLIKIADILKNEKFALWDYTAIKLPFSIYFGWITVAAIANITVFLVSLNWNGFGLADSTWMIIVLFVGIIIGIWRMLLDRNIAYGLVFVWAYAGILYKHVSVGGFGGRYENVIIAVTASIVILLAAIAYLSFEKNKSLKK